MCAQALAATQTFGRENIPKRHGIATQLMLFRDENLWTFESISSRVCGRRRTSVSQSKVGICMKKVQAAFAAVVLSVPLASIFSPGIATAAPTNCSSTVPLATANGRYYVTGTCTSGSGKYQWIQGEEKYRIGVGTTGVRSSVWGNITATGVNTASAVYTDYPFSAGGISYNWQPIAAGSRFNFLP
jgi:hypothetical protein